MTLKDLLLLCLIFVCSACTTTSVDKPTTISEVISLCKNVNASTEIPVKCNAEYIKDNPVITLVFPDTETANQWSEQAIEYIGAPFCMVSNSANRQAFLVIGIEDLAKGRYFECETQNYSEWFTLNPEDIPQSYAITSEQEALLNKTLETCAELHNNEELELSCTFELVKNKPMMYIAFPNNTAMTNRQVNVNEQLISPLCSVFEQTGSGAFFFIINVEQDEGLLYSCKMDQFSDWLNMNNQVENNKTKTSM